MSNKPILRPAFSGHCGNCAYCNIADGDCTRIKIEGVCAPCYKVESCTEYKEYKYVDKQ